MILLDTNVLARVTNTADRQCEVSRKAIHALLRKSERLVVVPQNLYEFWTIATRSAGPPPSGRNGLGMTPLQAAQWNRFFHRRFTFLPDREDLFDVWQSLVVTFSIRGFRAHDARLVAAMKTYGIADLLTFNGADFQNLGINVLDPSTVAI